MGIFGGSKKSTASIEPKVANSLNVQTAVQGLCLPVAWGQVRLPGNLIWYDDFKSTAVSSGGAGGGKGGGGGGGGGSVTYVYSTSVMMALCEGPIAAIGTVWIDKSKKEFAKAGFSLLAGGEGQQPWPYLVSNHPHQALHYPRITCVAASNYSLGDQPNLANHSFEVVTTRRFDPAGGVVDANPADILPDLLSHPVYGAGFPVERLDDLTSYSDYCVANGIFVSPLLSEQKEAREHLSDLLQITNSDALWSAGRLRIIPQGDEEVSGNGVVWTPDLTPAYELTADDFLASDGEPPIRVTRTTPADAYNRLKVEVQDRANDYNNTVVEAVEQALIEQFGERDAPSVTAHAICRPDIGRHVAQLLLQRLAYVRNQAHCVLSARYSRLEPGDYVTVPKPGTVNGAQLVRVIEVDEDEEFNLSISAEVVQAGAQTAGRYAAIGGAGFAPDYNVDPGDAHAPILFDAPVELADTGLEVWMAVAGGADWGGCEVWISSDDATYARLGVIQGGCRTGTLSVYLPPGSDPDHANGLFVDLAESRGQLLSGTQADADGFHTLCWVDGELVAYQTAALIGPHRYELSYLRRGVYGTLNRSHAPGARFARLDDSVFAYSYTAGQIGQTIFVKLVSFNPFGGALQDISQVTAHEFTIQGPPRVSAPMALSAHQNGAVVVFAWPRRTEAAAKGYDIAYGPKGCMTGLTVDHAWEIMHLLTEEGRGTEMTTASVPPGDWTFAIRTRDVADRLSPDCAAVDLAVVNSLGVVISDQAAPDWSGTLIGWVRHWTGSLVADTTKRAIDMTDAELWDVVAASPVDAPVYETPVFDARLVDSIRIWAEMVGSTPAPGSGNVSLTLWVDWSDDGVSWGGWRPWTVGYTTARFFRGRLVASTALGGCVVDGYRLVIDQDTKSETLVVNANPGGSVVTFGRLYRTPPWVNAGAVGPGLTGASATNITEAGCIAHAFTGADDTGGTVTLTVRGN